MPTAAKHPCTYPGCGALVDAGRPRCDAHRKQAERERSARRRADPDDQIHFHNSQAWRNLRTAFLRTYSLCVECEKEGRVTPATVVDHIKAIADGGDRTAFENLQALCKPHHDSKTWTELNSRRRETGGGA